MKPIRDFNKIDDKKLHKYIADTINQQFITSIALEVAETILQKHKMKPPKQFRDSWMPFPDPPKEKENE